MIMDTVQEKRVGRRLLDWLPIRRRFATRVDDCTKQHSEIRRNCKLALDAARKGLNGQHAAAVAPRAATGSESG